MSVVDVEISEVGPRDGLQGLAGFVPTAVKNAWVSAEAAAGAREIEVCSFVPAKVTPQFADAVDVVAHALTLPGLTVAALVPNLKGAENAIAAGVHKITFTLSASRGHSVANVRRTPDEQLAEFARIVAHVRGLPPERRPFLSAGLSTVFGCAIDGVVDEAEVCRLAAALAELGADDISLADTVGHANPTQIRRVVGRVRAEVGDRLTALHLHDTRGLGLANVLAGLDVGVRAFDSSLGGLGGCPFAPGASGNIVTEDLVFMLESMGLRTGFDLDRLLETRRMVEAALPGERFTGNLHRAGPPKGFHPAAAVSEPAPSVFAVPAAAVPAAPAPEAPLAGLRVLELDHMVMGPCCGLILGDLGADVIKVEPLPGGDKTRGLTGSGAGFFSTYNRNKRSITVDLSSAEGVGLVTRLARTSDVLVENLRAGSVARMGLGWETLSAINPRLIYCSMKGFLPGPYENRTALDEVVQMMGGLAHMTGPRGRPLRAGASVNDVMGGMFAVIAIQAALRWRETTGRGQLVRAGLFENNVFLMGQHMAQYAVTGEPAAPMPERLAAWAVYDLFLTADGEHLFLGVVTDTQWRAFCRHFALADLLNDPGLATNPQRVAERRRILPVVESLCRRHDKAALMAAFETLGLPYAPTVRPEELFDDPHLNQSGGLLDVTLPSGATTRLPALPVEIGGRRPGVRRDIPRAGQHTREVLAEIGVDDVEIDRLMAVGVVGGGVSGIKSEGRG